MNAASTHPRRARTLRFSLLAVLTAIAAPNAVGCSSTPSEDANGESAQDWTVLPPNLPPLDLRRDVLTQHNNANRTGATLVESDLTPATVRSGFGRLYTRAVDGQIFAQPLYADGVDVHDRGAMNLVLVATLANTVYAFDADDLAGTSPPVGSWSLGAPAAIHGRNFDSSVGILSTPVFDRATETLYVVARVATELGVVFQLSSIAIAKGRLATPVTVTISTTGFLPDHQLQRPGLLLRNGVVYIAFGSMTDWPPYHGYVFAYDAATLTQKAVFNTTPGDEGGGIWQAGTGLSADGNGIYFLSANSTSPATTRVNYEDSMVRLQPGTLSPLGSFSPDNVYDPFWTRKRADMDLGSSGALLIPGTNTLVGGGKTGRFYLLDRSSMTDLQEFQAVHNTYREKLPTETRPHCDLTKEPTVDCYVTVWDYPHSTFYAPHIHGAPVWWRGASTTIGNVYVWGEKDYLRRYRFDLSTQRFVASDITAPLKGPVRAPKDSMPGGVLSISANGNRAGTGIVWGTIQGNDSYSCGAVTYCTAEDVTVPGRFYAFDAETLTQLYKDDIPKYAKFAAPTIARGKVFLATHDGLYVYGRR